MPPTTSPLARPPFPIVVVDQPSLATAQPVTLTVNALVHPNEAAGQGHSRGGPRATTQCASGSARTVLQSARTKALQDMGCDVNVDHRPTFPAISSAAPSRSTRRCTGPVGIVKATGEAASTVPVIGPAYLLAFTALISMSPGDHQCLCRFRR